MDELAQPVFTVASVLVMIHLYIPRRLPSKTPNELTGVIQCVEPEKLPTLRMLGLYHHGTPNNRSAIRTDAVALCFEFKLPACRIKQVRHEHSDFISVHYLDPAK
jgi:hypothetical protein